MSSEIERKFLLKDKAVLDSFIEKYKIKQSYLAETNNQTSRVRLMNDYSGEERAFFTIKSKLMANGIERKEFEYEIPYDDACEIFNMGESYIEKERYVIPCQSNPDLKWEIDVFTDKNIGLIIVEIEIPTVDFDLKIPDWLGEEITHDKRYNSNKTLSLNNITSTN